MNRHQRRNRSGAVAVEMALTLTVLFLFLFGAIELGLANMMNHTAEAAAYEGARVAMLPGAVASEAETATRNILATARINVADVQINPANLTQDTDTVEVTVTVDFATNIPLVPRFMTTGPLVKSCRLSREKVE